VNGEQVSDYEELPENWREVLETVSENMWQERLRAMQAEMKL
jgi:hypothetical protein